MTSSFPQLAPTSRSFDPGNFPVKTYAAQDGDEVRLLYGNKRVGMKMALTYENITDTQAEEFLTHFHQMKGTYTLFPLKPSSVTGLAGAKKGWTGTASELDAHSDSSWRYEGPPRLTSVYPGRSTVTVNLIAALS